MNTKQRVLETLENNKGTPISGGALASRLDISRTAIWKAINGLREDGYNIVGQARLGYVLDASSDILSVEGISPYLRYSVPLEVFDSVDSTNTVASNLAMQKCRDNTTVIANHQSHGRGRRGRSFYSPQGTGLYMSLVLRPKCSQSNSVLITAAASVAVARAINIVCHKQAQIKWVNDLYLDGKKICGILTEALTDVETGQLAHIVLGIGINCFTRDFPDIAGPSPGSIPSRFSKNALAGEVINQVLELMSELDKGQFIDYYRQHSMVIGKEIYVYPSGTNSVISATAMDIDSLGGLVIINQDGEEKTLRSGEITIRLSDT